VKDRALVAAFEDGVQTQRRTIRAHPTRTPEQWAVDLLTVTARIDRLAREIEHERGRREVLARVVGQP
jgi:hypothetical protein